MPNQQNLNKKKTGNTTVFHPKYRISGFSLIEALVAIVILSFGLLGMVGMQAAALHANREARLQSAGIVLARELAEMIRGNTAVGVLASSNPYLVNVQSPLAATTPSYCLNVASGTCTDTTDIANAEMTEWLSRVDAELPGARVVSCFDTTPFDTSSGLPKWTCSNTGTVIAIKLAWTRGSTNKANIGAAALERATDTNSVPSIILQVTAAP